MPLHSYRFIDKKYRMRVAVARRRGFLMVAVRVRDLD